MLLGGGTEIGIRARARARAAKGKALLAVIFFVPGFGEPCDQPSNHRLRPSRRARAYLTVTTRHRSREAAGDPVEPVNTRCPRHIASPSAPKKEGDFLCDIPRGNGLVVGPNSLQPVEQDRAVGFIPPFSDRVLR